MTEQGVLKANRGAARPGCRFLVASFSLLMVSAAPLCVQAQTDVPEGVPQIVSAPLSPPLLPVSSPAGFEETESGDDAETALPQPIPVPSSVPKPPALARSPVIGETPSQSRIPADPSSSAEPPPVYYDSTLLMPPAGSSMNTSPRAADPVMEPASRFVVVTKESDATGIEAMIVAGNRSVELGRYDSALDIFDQLYARNRRDPRIVMGRALALQKVGRTPAAIAAYEELLSLAPDNANAMVNMLGLIKQSDPAAALRRLLDLRQKFPGHTGVIAQLGLTHAELGNLEEALRYLGMAASMEPRNAGHYFNMAVISDRMGQSKQAVTYYEKALDVDMVDGGGRSVPRDKIYQRLSALRNL